MKSWLIFLCIVDIFNTLSAANYCALSCDYEQNIACNHNNKFHPSCSSNARMITITDSIKQLLVGLHNEKRNLIAGGGMAKYRPACRMATMQWDDELAYLASFNVKQCRAAHDKCRRTSNFEYPGQNIALFWHSPPRGYVANEQFIRAVNGWYAEAENCTQSFIDRYPNNYRGPKIGHFTVMMQDRNIRLGCAASNYIMNGQENILITCNYASTNVITGTTYGKCSKAGMECATGTNPHYPNLCSTSEYYDNVNS